MPLWKICLSFNIPWKECGMFACLKYELRPILLWGSYLFFDWFALHVVRLHRRALKRWSTRIPLQSCRWV